MFANSLFLLLSWRHQQQLFVNPPWILLLFGYLLVALFDKNGGFSADLLLRLSCILKTLLLQGNV